ncbi:MAG: tRNA pseudouridine(38-40) synthase TruA [Chlamydiia bacterium]|nr:tRNA pseudouridine(38-40) synthase TruA [Chlamydiia bacterium]
MNIKCVVAYDGTDYFGWQKHPDVPTIEGTLEPVLSRVCNHPVMLQAASRTDTGVHARGQVIQFHTERDLTLSINTLFPPAIQLLSIEKAAEDFHPTLDAKEKTYHYQITNAPVQLPEYRHFAWHVPQLLDLKLMEEAIPHLLGTHDFTSFCNFRKGLNYKDKIRTLTALTVTPQPNNQLLITVSGPNFLYKMVRNIVGTLVDIGLEKIAPQALPAILAAKKRPVAGLTAPAHGLTLHTVRY